MAIANLHETLLSYKLRQSELNLEITNLQDQKRLAVYSQADMYTLAANGKSDVKKYFKDLYENDPALQEQYKNYTEIPDFEEEIDKITAEYQEKIDELTAWETAIDSQITTDSAELEEVNAYMESLKSMLQTNLQEDFNYGLNK